MSTLRARLQRQRRPLPHWFGHQLTSQQRSLLGRKRKVSHDCTVNLEKEEEEAVLANTNVKDDPSDLSSNPHPRHSKKQEKHVRFSPVQQQDALPNHPDSSGEDHSDDDHLDVQIHEIPYCHHEHDGPEWSPIWYRPAELRAVETDAMEELQDAADTMAEIAGEQQDDHGQAAATPVSAENNVSLVDRLLLTSMVVSNHKDDDDNSVHPQEQQEQAAQELLQAWLFQAQHNVYYPSVRGLETDLLVLQMERTKKRRQQQSPTRSRSRPPLIARMKRRITTIRKRRQKEQSCCLQLTLPQRHVQAVLRAQQRHRSIVAATAPTSRASAHLARVYAAYDAAVALNMETLHVSG